MQLKQGLESVNGHRLLKFRWQFIPQYTTFILEMQSHIDTKAKLLWMTSHRGPGSSSLVWRHSRNTQASNSVPLTVDLLNRKSIDFDILSRTTTVPSFKSLRLAVFVLSC